jgi:hypothetical protein
VSPRVPPANFPKSWLLLAGRTPPEPCVDAPVVSSRPQTAPLPTIGQWVNFVRCYRAGKFPGPSQTVTTDSR